MMADDGQFLGNAEGACLRGFSSAQQHLPPPQSNPRGGGGWEDHPFLHRGFFAAGENLLKTAVTIDGSGLKMGFLGPKWLFLVAYLP